jgi:ABC-2 type transport system permease protein
MSKSRLLRAELRKLWTTKMPVGFLVVLVVISAITAIAVIYGKDADGTKGFIATRLDQRSLLAFAANAMVIAGLFGAIAVAREYGHNTVIPMFLITPRRRRAMLAQLTAIVLAGGILGLVGEAITFAAGSVSITIAGQGIFVTLGDVVRLLAAAALAGGAGALLGAGVGAIVRNTGGAVTGAVLLLIIVPPIAVQLTTGAASWMPSTLANVASGVGEGPSLVAATLALVLWGLIPAVLSVAVVQRRDVV